MGHLKATRARRGVSLDIWTMPIGFLEPEYFLGSRSTPKHSFPHTGHHTIQELTIIVKPNIENHT